MSREHRTVTLTAEQQARHEEIRRQVERDRPAQARRALQRKGELEAMIGAFRLLREEWQRRGLSIREVSDRAGIDCDLLETLATAKNPNLTLSTLLQIAEVLGVQVTLGGERRVA